VTSVATRPSAYESGDSELRLEVPGNPADVRVVRLIAVDAAARAGFDCDRADDLRIALDELCHAVMDCTDAPLSVTFAIHGDEVEVEGTAARGCMTPPFALASVSGRIVRAVADWFEVVDEPSAVRFRLRLRAGRGGAR
jgi:hypothetical protein